jgi:RNA polymerase sigma-70 factor (ECF subfamily)
MGIDPPSAQERFIKKRFLSKIQAEEMRSSEHWDWDRLRRQCEREARRLLADTHDAEDAVQEAMARAWRRRHRCRSPERPLPWFLQITRNEAFRVIASKRPVERDTREWATVDPEIDRAVLRVDVHRALARLPVRDRTLAGLRYGEDLAQTRIAALLDTPEGTIRVQLHRLRKRLRGELREILEGDYQPQ